MTDEKNPEEQFLELADKALEANIQRATMGLTDQEKGVGTQNALTFATAKAHVETARELRKLNERIDQAISLVMTFGPSFLGGDDGGGGGVFGRVVSNLTGKKSDGG